jgi:hypothetical protein
MSVQPLPNEISSSLVWRCAQEAGFGLGEFCRWVLEISYSRRVGDLDATIAGPCRLHCSRVLGIPEPDILSTACPQEVRRSVWSSDRRCFSGRIWACPECLTGSLASAGKDWSSVLGSICPIHRCFLVGSCGECGEVLRYQNHVGGQRLGHWLELWPFCAACGAEIAPGTTASSALATMAAAWQAKLNSSDVILERRYELRIVAKLARRMRESPVLVARFLQLLALPADVDGAAVAALCAYTAYSRGLYAGNDADAHLLCNCLLGVPAEDVALANALASLV